MHVKGLFIIKLNGGTENKFTTPTLNFVQKINDLSLNFIWKIVDPPHHDKKTWNPGGVLTYNFDGYDAPEVRKRSQNDLKSFEMLVKMIYINHMSQC